MKKLFSILVIFGIALVSNLVVHFQPDKPPEDFNSGYTCINSDSIDYHADYLRRTQQAIYVNKDACDIVPKALKAYKDKYDILKGTSAPEEIGIYSWFVSSSMYRGSNTNCLTFSAWSANTDKEYIDASTTYGDALDSNLPVPLLGNYSKSGSDNNYYYYIVSPCSLLVSSSASKSDYGHRMELTTVNGNYRFTFYNMTCWYCCINRLGNVLDDLPLPNMSHTEDALACSIGKGQVVGVGNKNTTVQVEKYDKINDTWLSSSLREFYNLPDN